VIMHSSFCLPECRALRSNTIEHEMLDAVRAASAIQG